MLQIPAYAVYIFISLKVTSFFLFYFYLIIKESKLSVTLITDGYEKLI